jgi:hypothetical protein
MRKIPSRYYPRIVACTVLLGVAGVTGGVFAAAAVKFVIVLTLGLAMAEVMYAVTGFKQHRKLSLASTAVIMALMAALAWYLLADAAAHGSVSLRIDGYQMLLLVAMGPLLHIEHNRRVGPGSPPASAAPQPSPAKRRRKPTLRVVLLRLAWYAAAAAMLDRIGVPLLALAYPPLSAAHVAVAWLLRSGSGIELHASAARQPRLLLFVLAELLGASLVAIGLVMLYGRGDAQLTLLAAVLALLAGEQLLGWHEARALARPHPA